MTEEKNENFELEVTETPAQEENQVAETVAETTEEAAAVATEEIATEAEAEVVAETKSKPQTKTSEPTAEPEEFDWASLEVGLDAYSVKERDKLADMYNNTLNTVSEKEVLQGT
ncbi:MAG TPA: hypothetical protein DER09_01535, partial [Prolixibacteraceae bacterium]|nr:hypothetical protein [Prolixibacteraceae bacterium]